MLDFGILRGADEYSIETHPITTLSSHSSSDAKCDVVKLPWHVSSTCDSILVLTIFATTSELNRSSRSISSNARFTS